jgi:hypothetical protein
LIIEQRRQFHGQGHALRSRCPQLHQATHERGQRPNQVSPEPKARGQKRRRKTANRWLLRIMAALFSDTGVRETFQRVEKPS